MRMATANDPSKQLFANGREVIARDAKTGTVTYEVWWKNGQQHRDDGPALIRRDAATGTVSCEVWWEHGQRHRADGPAFIQRDAATGTVTYEEWWIGGKVIPRPVEAAAA